MKYRVIVTPDAERDLRQVYGYVRQQGAPLAARKWLAGARKELKSLARFPHRGMIVPEAYSFNEPIRELLYGHGQRGTYRMIYTVIDDCVLVLHIRYGSRLPLTSEV